jgi:hypothetical protein
MRLAQLVSRYAKRARPTNPALTQHKRGWCRAKVGQKRQGENHRFGLGIWSFWQRAPGRIRTCDTRFRKPVLYPLSYEGPVKNLTP